MLDFLHATLLKGLTLINYFCNETFGMSLLFHIQFQVKELAHNFTLKFYSCLKNSSMITVTDNAVNQIIALKKEEGKSDNYNIRVAVEGGGCSGLMYDLLFDAEVKEKDEVFEDKGIKILVDRKSMLYLLGTTLDFSGGLNGKGFQFVNPNASRTCGCGESFAV
jgi:iron-sulfur cluster assembly protein